MAASNLRANYIIAIKESISTMKNLFRSQVTFDTLNYSNSSLHNCPNCRCRSSEHSTKFNNSLSQPFLQTCRNTPNLYLSNNFSDHAQSQQIATSPFSSGIFQNKIKFKYTTKASQSPNITFSYISPPKSKKHRSTDAKFSTKNFKNRHFPHLHDNDSQGSPIKKTLKDKKQNNPYFQVFTDEKTPEKHKILKMNKSKQKLQITLSKKSSSQKSIDKEPQIQVNQAKIYNDYEFSKEPRLTPINALWLKDIPQTEKNINSQKKLVNSQVINYNQSISIEHIKPQRIQQPLQYIHSSLPRISDSQIVGKKQSAKVIVGKKYPTIKSIQIYEQRQNQNLSEQMKTNRSKDDNTSLMDKQRECNKQSKKSIQSLDKNLQIAKSISDELQLHYDYYNPFEESDRSLSINVTL